MELQGTRYTEGAPSLGICIECNHLGLLKSKVEYVQPFHHRFTFKQEGTVGLTCAWKYALERNQFIHIPIIFIKCLLCARPCYRIWASIRVQNKPIPSLTELRLQWWRLRRELCCLICKNHSNYLREVLGKTGNIPIYMFTVICT